MNRFWKLVLVLAALSLGSSNVRAQGEFRAAGYMYLSPVPGASYVSAQTRYVLVRFQNVTPVDVTNLTTDFITVTGANSGSHSGVTHVASDGRTVIFTTGRDFSPNELVTVTLNPELSATAAGVVLPFEYQFMVTAPMPGSLPTPTLSAPARIITPDGDPVPADGPLPGPEPGGGGAVAVAAIQPNGVSVPSDFPVISIPINTNSSPGYLFLENSRTIVPGYAMMLDNNGSPVWYRRGPFQDFKIQDNGTITWSVPTSSTGVYFWGFDQNFNLLRTFKPVNGYTEDTHDIKIRADGTYLMLGNRANVVNLSLYYPGGSTSANVTEGVIQEFTPQGDLIFQWRAWDNFATNIQTSGADFTHMNGLDYDEDGNILLSSRHLWEVTKINRDNGDIIWRLGGPSSSFTFVNDPFNGPSAQHNISALGNNHYLVFDNGNGHTPRVSRAVEYQLDLTNMTATLVWQFRDVPDKYTDRFGSAQRLPSGNTLINFASAKYPKAIEVDTNGVKSFELTLTPSAEAYRAFRFPWNGVVAAPYLIVEPQADNVSLIFNKFGDTNVASYRIYGGTSPAPTNLLATATTTLKHLTTVVNGVRNYFRVTAVSREGVESEFSNEENLVINISLPGQNMVLNGDFSQGSVPWTWQVTPPAAAQWLTTGGISHFLITSGGTYLTDIQLLQTGMKLTQGKEYTLEFDAWSVAPRMIEATVEQNFPGGVNYSGLQPTGLTPATNHFSFQFAMTQPTDNNARVVFNVGALPQDVYLANVSLRERVYAPGDFNWDGCVGFSDLKVLTSQWQKALGQSADLNGDGKVDFGDFVRFANSWTDGNCP
jgi:Arylsulfotransferase (ASST)/Carbohydrate binding domain